ncbi:MULTISPECIES: hypothetical protein [unclassified Streptomyces]|uniref:hypothetical protein n=1 Tax=unclassified Streptomyces TaxID=2593676 RepID=UPI00382E21E5
MRTSAGRTAAAITAGASALPAGCASDPDIGPVPATTARARRAARTGPARTATSPDGNASGRTAAYTRDGDVSGFGAMRAGTDFGGRLSAKIGGKPFVHVSTRGHQRPVARHRDRDPARSLVGPLVGTVVRSGSGATGHRPPAGVRDTGDRTGPDRLRRGDHRPRAERRYFP